MAIIGRAEVEVVANTSKFEQQVKRGVGGAGGELQGFSKITAKVEGHLAQLGLSSQQLGVIMGAGLAGGVAFAAREVIEFTAAVVEASSALEEQRTASEQIFASNQGLIRSFAESAASIGLSERAALQATSTFGGFFKNIGYTEDAAAKLAVGFTSLASDAASFFDISVEDAQQRIISGLRGEQEAVERLNVTINEKMVADRAMTETGKDAAEQLTEGEKKAARAKIIIEQLGVTVGNYALTADGLANSQRTLNAEWENAKAALGDILTPVVADAVQDLVVLAGGLKEISGAIGDLKERAEEAAGPLGKVIGPVSTFLKGVGNGPRLLAEGFRALGIGEEEVVDSTENVAGAMEALDTPINEATRLTGDLTEETEKLADAETRLSRATADAARNIERAKERLNRAIQDSEIRIDKAERNVAESIEDGAERIDDAEDAVAEAYEDRADRIAEAEKAVADARREAEESVAELRERLTEAELDSARRIEDAERRLAEARRDRARSIHQATLSLEQAMAAGDAEAENAARLALEEAKRDQSVNDAERDLTQSRADRERELQQIRDDIVEQRKKNIRDIAEAEKDLADTIEEQNKRVKESEEDLAEARKEAAEKIAQARRDLAEAERDSARAIEDAQQGVTDAIRNGEEAVYDAQKAYDKLNGELAETNELLKEQQRIIAEGGLLPLTGGPAYDLIASGGHAHGGRPVPGEVSWVGEQGPELVRWGTAGDVLPVSTIARLMREAMNAGPGGEGGGVIINIYPQSNDGRVIANEIAYRLAQGVF